MSGESGRAPSLILETGSGTAIVEGERVELPPREFRLLCALTERAGEMVVLEDLIRAAWPADADWTPKNDLYVLMTKLRRAIDGPSRFGNHIRNRRGFGYVLELAPADVLVVQRFHGPEDLEQSAPEREEQPVPLDQTALAPVLTTPARRERDVFAGRKDWRGRRFVAAGIASLVAIATAWAVGYAIATRDGELTQDTAEPTVGETEDPSSSADNQDRRKGKRKEDRQGGKDKSRQENGPGSSPSSGGSSGATNVTTLAAAPATTSDSESAPRPARDASGSDSQQQAKEDKPEPPPPPQPDAQLYHLVSAEGDHFMTTSSASATQKQGDGYSASGEGRVFSSPQEGTVAIGLHEGSAYIYSSAAAAPEGSNVAPLYRLSKSGGFFYTTSSSLANQAQAEGWGRATAGFVLL